MILLIDDDPQFQNEAQHTAVLQPVVAANGARQATTLMNSLGSEMTLALIDLDLPETDGFQVIQSFKKAHPSVPVVAISGVFSHDVLESAKCLGADDVLSKPITPEWTATVERLRGVFHSPGTGHFRCRCGERLMFGSGPGMLTPLAETTRVGKLKRGRCPKCGTLHSIHY
jgi:CheY-like chemotaxis protein